MVSLIILAVLAYCFYSGARRGVWLQLIHVVGYLFSLGLAWATYRPLGVVMTQWVPYPSATEQSQFVFFTNQVGLTLDHGFYNGVAFVFMLMVGWLVTRFVALWFHNLTYRVGDQQVSWLVGGVLNFLMGYLFIFLVLYLFALIPVTAIQDMLAHSLIARSIVRYTPGLTSLFTTLWIAK
ncbi:CvpA family protein [Lacticaseibacillus baoqingensis]|uniref:CvpA family protein n=1 Tax=Lacticaseibacillus baoqingensis TaxID=2486013 RepID=A0ABW4EB31_9LACO|nr:CvpA family protein [Lacticaseibacillus baoqingensis]